MASVPLASIQDEWSEFVDFKNDRRPVNGELPNGTRSSTVQNRPVQNQSDKRNSNRNSQDNCDDQIDRSKDKQSKFSTDSTRSSASNESNARHPGDQTDEEEEEFRAFQQQFEQIKQQSDLDGEPKIKVESLEELVKTFDERIVNCFVDYEEPVDSLAPVQVLNPEELIAECK